MSTVLSLVKMLIRSSTILFLTCFPVTGHFFICSFLVRIWLPSNPVLITLSPVQCFVRFLPLQINYGRVRHDFKFQTHPLSLTPSSLSLSPFLLVPCQLDVIVFELFSGKLVKKLDGGHYNMVTCCAVKPNDFEVYTGSSDKGIVVWSGKLHSDEEVCGGEEKIMQSCLLQMF